MTPLERFIAVARSQVGTPYQYAPAATPEAFDCSSLVQWASDQL